MKFRVLAAAAAVLPFAAVSAAHATDLNFNDQGEDGSFFSFDLD